MPRSPNSSLHDAYAADYDSQVLAYDCHIADLLFGLCYEFTSPGQSLLDLGIGSGLSARLFAKTGLQVSGMDFSPTMLEICRSKGFAANLRQHDLQIVPWPYPLDGFQYVVCCGVLHFLEALDEIFREVQRVLAPAGYFAFTTRLPERSLDGAQTCRRKTEGDFEIFSHSPAHLEALLARHAFTRLKVQKCFVGEDAILLWVTQKKRIRNA